MSLAVLLVTSSIAAPPFDLERLRVDLLERPEATLASLRSAQGLLGTAFPSPRGSLDDAPVYLIDAAYSEELLEFDVTLGWTNRSATPLPRLMLVDMPHVQLSAADELRPRHRDHGLRLTLPTPVAPGQSVSVRVEGVVQRAEQREEPKHAWRMDISDGRVISAWVPKVALRSARGWEPTDPMVGDPCGADAAIFVLALRGLPREADVVHPGVVLHETPSTRLVVAVGVRELPLLVLGPSWRRVVVPGNPPVELRAQKLPGLVQPRAERLRAQLDYLTSILGPLPHHRVVAVAAMPDGHGIELPGILLVPRSEGSSTGMVSAHELGHQWFYGEVGTLA
ncbi:MAG: hypothetical protein AAF211_23630, partial [Myxococcota bacterium]